MKRLEEYEIEVERSVECCMGKLNGLVKCLGEKDLHTIKLEQKICDMEKQNDLQNKRIDKLDNESIEHLKKIEMLSERLTSFENSIPSKSNEKHKCKMCDFIGQSAQGLKTHTTRKHTAVKKDTQHYVICVDVKL